MNSRELVKQETSGKAPTRPWLVGMWDRVLWRPHQWVTQFGILTVVSAIDGAG